ncbi:hypothetical protein [Mesorhizobium sp. IMUNJ 23232]|uniref:hypothetical protein n=1 Tax=Mesorhizobium sp. IMUNJ 23232 TaxID=3376064 RepID=UPI0037AAFAC7
MNFEPKKLIERLRSQLNRQGLPNLSGWLIAQVHGDYNPVGDHYQIHLHVLSVGNVGIAIEGLRGIAPYRPGEVKRPILRRAATNLMSRVPYYVAQPFWPMRISLPGGKRTSRRRLPPDRLADWLMWIDEQRFSDLIWLHGCSIQAGKLVAKHA